MSSTQTTDPPEAMGPGVPDELNGAVSYGDLIRPRTVPVPSRDPATDRRRLADPDAALNVIDVPAYGCSRCQGIPDTVLVPLLNAVAAGTARR